MSTRQRRFSVAAATLFVFFGALVAWDAVRSGAALPWRHMYDFPVTYCGGRVVAGGDDPFRYEPLHHCQQQVGGSDFQSDPARVLPWVIPPYSFPLLAMIGRMPFDAARTVFAILIAGAVVACVVLLASLGIDVTLVFAALLLCVGYLLLYAANVVAFTLLAVVLCGWALSKKHSVAAGVFAAAGLMEPHITLPICAAVFLFGDLRARIALVAGGAVLAGVAAMVPVAQILEYATRVLPAQAVAETHFPYQYSLTYVLTLFGTPPQPAILAGNLMYAALAIAAIGIGYKLSKTLRRPEMIVFTPAAAVVFGGSYMHMVDIGFAVPAALVLATESRGPARTIAGAALCLLAVPWLGAWQFHHLFLPSIFVCALILWRLHVPLLPASAIVTAIALTLYAFDPIAGSFHSGRGPLHYPPDGLAVTVWQIIVAGTSAPVAPWLAIKIPTWLSVGATLALAWRRSTDGSQDPIVRA